MDTVHENRHSYIGGSDVPALMGRGFKDRKQVVSWYAKEEKLEDTNMYMAYGTFMEEKIRNYINEKYDLNFSPECKIFEDKRIRCNTDGYDSKNKMILEVKTNNGKHSNTIDYELQMQLYMWAFDCSEGMLVQYTRPSDFYHGILTYEEKDFNLEFDPTKLKIKKIKRCEGIINKILEEIQKFWKDVENLKEALDAYEIGEEEC